LFFIHLSKNIGLKNVHDVLVETSGCYKYGSISLLPFWASKLGKGFPVIQFSNVRDKNCEKVRRDFFWGVGSGFTEKMVPESAFQ
jgi:hypothetical protein